MGMAEREEFEGEFVGAGWSLSNKVGKDGKGDDVPDSICEGVREIENVPGWAVDDGSSTCELVMVVGGVVMDTCEGRTCADTQ